MTSRSASRCCAIWAPCWSRSMASPTIAGLFDVATHRRLLDAFGGYDDLISDVAGALCRLGWRAQGGRGIAPGRRNGRGRCRLSAPRGQRISVLAPVKGEEEALASERAFLMNAGRIAEDISAAIDALSGDRGAEGTLATALKRLARMGEEARKAIEGAENSLEQAFALTQEARRDLDLGAVARRTRCRRTGEEGRAALRPARCRAQIFGAGRRSRSAPQRVRGQARFHRWRRRKAEGGRRPPKPRPAPPISRPRTSSPPRARPPPASSKPPSPASWCR